MADSQHHSVKNLAALGYLLLFLGCLFGVTALIGALINHTLLHKTSDSIERSHLLLQLIAFWTLVIITAGIIATVGSSVATVLMTIGIGVWTTTLVFGAAWLFMHRAVPFI